MCHSLHYYQVHILTITQDRKGTSPAPQRSLPVTPLSCLYPLFSCPNFTLRASRPHWRQNHHKSRSPSTSAHRRRPPHNLVSAPSFLSLSHPSLKSFKTNPVAFCSFSFPCLVLSHLCVLLRACTSQVFQCSPPFILVQWLSSKT